MKFWTFLGFAVACTLAAGAVAGESASFGPIVTEPGALKGTDGHVQGIACSDEHIYLAFTTDLIKLDWTGKVVKRAPARRHTGDIAYRNGRLYACVGKTKDPNKGLGGLAHIQVFDTDLNLIGEKRTPSAPGIDGIGIWGDNEVFVGGGSVECGKPHTSNLVVRLNAKLEPTASAWVDYGSRTKHGVQNVTVANGLVWCFFYPADPKKGDKNCAILDRDLRLVGTFSLGSANGVDILPPRFGKSVNPRFLVCRTIYPTKTSEKRAELSFVEVVPTVKELTSEREAR